MNRSVRTLAVITGAYAGIVGLMSVGAEPLAAASAAWSLPVQEGVEAPGPGVVTSERCALCHESSPNAVAMRDAKERSVAPYDLWRSTMMANSSRDPFWRAVVDAEIAAAPHAAAEIAAKCLKCHAPLAERIGLEDHGTEDVLHALSCDGELGKLAADGVSCTICHGMSPEGLGTPESFTAGFALDPWRRLFGPHEEPFPGPMRMHTGFEPSYGAHIAQSSLCGSCHTLVTHPMDGEGTATDIGFHEQTPYLEWRNSSFSNEAPDGSLLEPAPAGARTCQSCHVPQTDASGRPIRTRLAHNPGGFDFPFLEPRSPFGRHLFVGGNAFVLSLLRDHGDELGATAPAEAFDATIAATRDQLAHRSASLSISKPLVADGQLEFQVTVANLTGHKLPTGHPSRRMWLEVVVTGDAGEVLFASGRHDATGRIVGLDGNLLATETRGGPVEPHRELVTNGDQVARYRAVMADTDGEPTHTLMRGATWYVDDRILPRGWSAEHPDAPRAAPSGVGTDPDYGAAERRSGSAGAEAPAAEGVDRVTYRVPVPGAGDHRVSARLLYQSVSPRWVDEIAVHDKPAIRRFLGMYEAADRTPEVLAAASR